MNLKYLNNKYLLLLLVISNLLANARFSYSQILIEDNNENAISQVNNVSQLRDVSPQDWAYEALLSLVERYGCIAGYPNRTFRGNRALSRYEFAAGLNACMQKFKPAANS